MEKIMKENILDAICELKSTSLPNILVELVGKINDLEYRLSFVDKLPYPAHDENGELRYELISGGKLKEVK